MKAQRLIIAALIANLTLMLFVAARPSKETFDKITVREFELVDPSGKERASIKVEDSGEIVFRLRDAKGTIRVKMGASEGGSALVLLDDNTDAAIQIKANKEGGKFIATDKGGKQREY